MRISSNWRIQTLLMTLFVDSLVETNLKSADGVPHVKSKDISAIYATSDGAIHVRGITDDNEPLPNNAVMAIKCSKADGKQTVLTRGNKKYAFDGVIGQKLLQVAKNISGDFAGAYHDINGAEYQAYGITDNDALPKGYIDVATKQIGDNVLTMALYAGGEVKALYGDELIDVNMAGDKALMKGVESISRDLTGDNVSDGVNNKWFIALNRTGNQKFVFAELSLGDDKKLNFTLQNVVDDTNTLPERVIGLVGNNMDLAGYGDKGQVLVIPDGAKQIRAHFLQVVG